MSTETAEEFQPLQTENASIAAQFVQPAKTFRGKKLFPYSDGSRILLGTAAAGKLAGDHWLMILVKMLSDLQEGFEKYRAATPPLSEDEATDAAVADFLDVLAEGPSKYQAQVIRWASKFGKKGVEEAVALALEIFEEAKQTELVSANESPAPGK